ncbi:hypothetical protein HK097_003599, partial [Rhizophlyctis rosea]
GGDGEGGGGVKETMGTASSDLLKLARAMKMNTDVRRSIFVVLMSSEDCADAMERLLKLRLKDKQEREIVRVLLHCCAQEKVYNPYYALVAQKFCGHGHGFKITLQFALWDSVKAMGADGADGEEGSMDVRKVSHYARLYAYLIATESLTLGILKALNFTNLTPLQILFSQLLFSSILTTASASTSRKQADPDAHIKTIFGRVTTGAAAEQLEELREGIVFFMQQFLVGKQGETVVKEGERELVKRRVKVVKNVLVGKAV